jgi:methyltransferase family protein
MHDVLPRDVSIRLHASAESDGPDGKRSPPKAVKLLLPVWGYRYVRQFLELGLPTLIASGNIPALAKVLPCEFEILTSSEDEALIRQHPAFDRLTSVCPTTFRRIDHLITGSNYSTTVTLAYTEAIRATGPAMLDTCFFFLVSDYIVADGSLANALARMQAGANAVLVGNFQVNAEDATPWLRERIGSDTAGLAIAARNLMRWALGHLHPATIANTVNFPLSHNAHTNRLFWRVDRNTLLGRFYLMHMICIRPEVTDFNIGASCDYSFVPEMCPSGNVSMITDSDEFLIVEMQPRGHESMFLRPGPLAPTALARTLREWTTVRHRQNASYSVVYHADDPPAALPAAVATADAYVAQIARRLRRRPQPHRGHPYWLGAIAAFREATGQRISDQEFRYLLGVHDWRGLWIERLRSMLFGFPPRVRPWHPRWPDYRLVFSALADFLADPRQRLLTVSDVPTPFTVMLADGGERVIRLQTSPFLRSAPETYKTFAGRFDTCLVELEERDLARSADLVNRLAPLMKDQGRIVIVMYNQRPMDEAAAFTGNITRRAQQLLPASAAVKEIKFVPASRLRWAAHRVFSQLGAIIHQSPRIGIPALAILVAPLTLLTFLVNLAAAAGTRSTLNRRIASSLHLVVQMEALSAMAEGACASPAGDAPGGPQRAAAAERGPARDESTREPQYNRCLDVARQVGLTPLGLMTNQVWHDDPRRLGILLARYKFVAKMLSGRRDVGELGCGDAFGTRIVLQEVNCVTAYDFDPVFIEDVRRRRTERWAFDAHVHDILAGPLPRRHDAIYSLDVIEHIARHDEDVYLQNLRASLTRDGVLIVGTPSLESQAYASPQSKAGHVNCKTGPELKTLLEQHFHSVFLFSMNDEVVHTGFHPMAHYLFAICSQKMVSD